MQNLKIGSKGNDVLQLQKFLQGQGLYNGKLDGIYGPQTQGAVQVFQGHANLKPDGIVGPLTQNAISNYQPLSAPQNNSGIGSGNDNMTADQILSGNYSDTGYDPNYVQSLNNQSLSEISPYYTQEQNASTYDIQKQLEKEQADYENYLASSAQNFQNEKDAADVNSANNGILFSTGRRQAQNNLQSKYSNDQADKLANYSSDVGTLANDYGYKYGTPAESSLSAYFGAPTNSYNATGTRAVITSNGVSPVYNPSISNYYGTQNTAKAYNAALRTAGKLGNQTNKGLLYGYKTQL